MDVILSEAKNLACGRQMFRLRLNMTTPQIISDRAVVRILHPETQNLKCFVEETHCHFDRSPRVFCRRQKRGRSGEIY